MGWARMEGCGYQLAMAAEAVWAFYVLCALSFSATWSQLVKEHVYMNRHGMIVHYHPDRPVGNRPWQIQKPWKPGQVVQRPCKPIRPSRPNRPSRPVIVGGGQLRPGLTMTIVQRSKRSSNQSMRVAAVKPGQTKAKLINIPQRVYQIKTNPKKYHPKVYLVMDPRTRRLVKVAFVGLKPQKRPTILPTKKPKRSVYYLLDPKTRKIVQVNFERGRPDKRPTKQPAKRPIKRPSKKP